MKLLISSLLAVFAGILSALFIPFGENAFLFLEDLSRLSINMGRYIIFPLVFFSLAIAVCKLRREKKLLQSLIYTILLLISATLVLVLIGVVVTMIVSPTRIPLIVETQSQLYLEGQRETIFSLFPRNLFTVFTGNSNILLPLYFLSFLLGFTMFKDKEVSEPTFNIFDSLSRILYEINIIITRLSPVFLAIISFTLVKSIKNISDLKMFNNLILILSLSVVIIILGIYPLVLYLTDKKKNPFRTLLSLLLPLLHGLISGDSFFTLSILTRTLKKDLNISRKTSAMVLPLGALFGKAGTALVTSTAFLTILKSYSSLEITLFQIFWVILFSFLVSFTLASFPAMGAYTAIYLLSEYYSRSHTGLTDSYLLLKPIVPILIGFAVLMDSATSAVTTILVSRRNELKITR